MLRPANRVFGILTKLNGKIDILLVPLGRGGCQQRANLEAQRADQEAQARRQAEQATEALRQRLREVGIDPNTGV